MPGLQAAETLTTRPLESLGDPDDPQGPFEDLYRLAMLAWNDEEEAKRWLLARKVLAAEQKAREAKNGR